MELNVIVAVSIAFMAGVFFAAGLLVGYHRGFRAGWTKPRRASRKAKFGSLSDDEVQMHADRAAASKARAEMPL